MTADDECAGIAEALHEVAAGARRLRLVHVEARFGGGYGDLDRVVHQIAGDDGPLAARFDQHADVSRRVARRGDERDLIGEAEVRIDVFLESGSEYRVDRIRQMVHVMIAAGVAQMLPVLPFAPPKEVSRLREGRHPLAIHQPGVPAHVIEVQVRAQHIGDRARRGSRRCADPPGRCSACCRTPRTHAAGHCRCRCRSSPCGPSSAARSTERR